MKVTVFETIFYNFAACRGFVHHEKFCSAVRQVTIDYELRRSGNTFLTLAHYYACNSTGIETVLPEITHGLGRCSFA